MFVDTCRWCLACIQNCMNRLTITKLRYLVPAAVILVALPVLAQTNGDQSPVVFRVEVVSRTTKAINYHHRQGSTTVTLQPSSFAPKAKGEVKVDSKTGATKVEAYIEKMPAANTLSDGYLTYVLWAITPEGRAENMGELMLEGDHARLQAATELQTFGMIVTAEPYYAVTQPSDTIVMEAVVNKDTTGTIMPIEAKYELVARGGYLQQLPPADRVRLREAKNMPLDLLEARQAVAVARSAGGDRYAGDTMRKADVDLGNAEAFHKSGQDKKKVQTLARHVTQLSEDARLISIKRFNEEVLARERSDNERRTTALTQTAENQTELRRQAEMETARKNREAMDAQQQAADARRATEQVQVQSAAAIAEKDRLLAAATARADAERIRQQALEMEAAKAREQAQAQSSAVLAEKDRQLAAASASAEAERMKQQTLEMESAKAREQAAMAQRERDDASAAKQRQLEQEAAQARQSAATSEEQARVAREATQRAEDERTKTRLELVRQFNIVLATRETARGLIVNMSDVLFDTGRHTLKPGAREKLAKIAGIILAHPGLKIEVEGHADSTGGPAINQPLSEKRAESVRTYLVAQGVDGGAITSQGLGDTKPVADNNTAAGRQANRRVELVVNGAFLNAPAPGAATSGARQ